MYLHNRKYCIRNFCTHLKCDKTAWFYKADFFFYLLYAGCSPAGRIGIVVFQNLGFGDPSDKSFILEQIQKCCVPVDFDSFFPGFPIIKLSPGWMNGLRHEGNIFMRMFSGLLLAYVPEIGSPKNFRSFSASRADFLLHVLGYGFQTVNNYGNQELFFKEFY